MNKKIIVTLFFIVLVMVVGLVINQVMNTQMVVVDPKGWIGWEQKILLNISTLLMFIVVIPVFVLMFLIIWRYHDGNKKATYNPEWSHSTVAEIVWWGVPTLIIIVLSVLNWIGCFKLDPFRPLQSEKEPIKIQVVALDWKWLFIYPKYNIATINYINFPVDTPIHFEISGDAPMNSFWIPELGGQIFAMAGMKTELHLIASHVGKYRGCSANLSGKGFSDMVFTAEASTNEDYITWIRKSRKSKNILNRSTYVEIAKPSINDPVSYYVVKDPDLFNWIIMKEMMPPNQMMEPNHRMMHENK